MRKIIILLIITFTVVSCGSPPVMMEETKFSAFISDVVDKLESIKNDIDKQDSFFKSLNEEKFYLHFEKDFNLLVKSSAFKPSDEHIVFSLDDNKFELNKDLYITAGKEKNTMIFSLDGLNWYQNTNDSEKNIENVLTDYNLSSSYNKKDNSVTINYNGAMKLGRKLVEYQIKDKDKKEIIKVDAGMIFSHTDKNKISLDISKNILYMPKGTKFSGNIKVDGNLVVTDNSSNIVSFKFLRDIYVYLRKNMVSISFDKKDWNISILSFKLVPEVEIVAENESCITMNVKALINYTGNN